MEIGFNMKVFQVKLFWIKMVEECKSKNSLYNAIQTHPLIFSLQDNPPTMFMDNQT